MSTLVQIGATKKSQKAVLEGILAIMSSAALRGDNVIIKALDVFGQHVVTRNITVSNSTISGGDVHIDRDYEPGWNGFDTTQLMKESK